MNSDIFFILSSNKSFLMRLFQYCMTSIILLLSFNHGISQSNCGNTLPVLDCPTDTHVCVNEIVQSSLLSNSNLPDLEYIIVDENTLATSGAGPAVVGFDQDGMFMPSDFALTSGGSFSVVPIAYDLSQIQETIDDILFGSVIVIIFNTSCCDLAITAGNDICGDLNAAGIFSGADVTSLEDAFALVPNANTLLTVPELIANLESVNLNLADPNVPPECGGGDVFCYASGNTCTYTIIPNSLVLSNTHITSELIEAENNISSSSIVQSPNMVEYLANNCIELTPNFETIIGSEFMATIDDPCN